MRHRRPPRRGIDSARALAVVALVSVAGLVQIASGSAVARAEASSTRCTNAAAIQHWNLSRRAAQLVVVPAQEADVGAVAPAVRTGVGGLVLFGDAAPATLGVQLARLDALAPGGVAPIVMADEEGGGVQRLANLVGALPWPRDAAETMSPAVLENLVAGVARRMHAEGVAMDLAPVLDLASGPGPDAKHTDGPRSFGPAPATATAYGLAFVRGLLSGGVIPVLKHFPGEGSATANTDDAPASTPPLSRLERADLRPFEAAIEAGAPAVMVGNASVPGLTAAPAILSPAVIGGLLRHQLGFRGLVVTDSLSAVAISARHLSVAAAAVQAVEAGADMVLFGASAPNPATAVVVAALVQAVLRGALRAAALNAAVLQVLKAKHVSLCRAA